MLINDISNINDDNFNAYLFQTRNCP